MLNLSKPFCLKFLLFAIALSFAPYSSVMAEEKKELFNSQEQDGGTDGKKMKSMSWNSPKPDEEKEDKEKKTESDSDITTEEDKATDGEEELTADQKLWKKYKDLAAGKDKKPEEANDDDALEDDIEIASEEESPSQDPANEKKASGLRGIIDNYRNAQKSKGKMNSRSYGNSD